MRATISRSCSSKLRMIRRQVARYPGTRRAAGLGPSAAVRASRVRPPVPGRSRDRGRWPRPDRRSCTRRPYRTNSQVRMVGAFERISTTPSFSASRIKVVSMRILARSQRRQSVGGGVRPGDRGNPYPGDGYAGPPRRIGVSGDFPNVPRGDPRRGCSRVVLAISSPCRVTFLPSSRTKGTIRNSSSDSGSHSSIWLLPSDLGINAS